MSLQVWLPLTGNIQNQGLANCTISGTPAYGDGKLGKALDLINSGKITISCPALNNKSQFSICFWIKGSKDTNDGDWASPIRFTSNKTDGTENNHFRFGKDNRADQTGYPIAEFNNSDFPITTSSVVLSGQSDWDNWIHVCFSTNGTLVKRYLNGQYMAGYNYGTGGWLTGTITLRDTRYNGFLNDFRVYDHVLSDKEVKILSRGLVLHYPLDRNNLDPYTGNLLLNGFGELGTTNWTTAARVYTDDLPTANTAIKARFTDNVSSEFIPIYRNHKYKFSTYVKSSNTSGSSYPSLYPYDIDKNFISTYNTKEGFNLSTLTTLKQQLKSGDTKIYVNDLSAWNANSGHYYNYAAIFGYKDSTGYTYPTGVYTRITPAFGSGTSAKTNLDKTNNVITLNSAYSGATIPAGTQVCASSAGNTYFYPVGGITNTSIADWTYKEGTFSSEHNRLVAAAYVKVYAYSTCTQAGIKLEDVTITNSSSNTTIYDTSGNGYNGIIYNDPVWDLSSPKYKASTHFTATNQYIRVTNLTTTGFSNSYSFSWWGNMDSWSSAMFWGFSDGVRLNGLFKGNLWNTGDSGNNPLYKPGTTTQVTSPSLNIWHHYVMIGNGTNCIVYLDGELWGQAKTYKTITGTTICFNGWDTSTSYTSSDMRISDFRIYATTLSAQDIKDLYDGLF